MKKGDLVVLRKSTISGEQYLQEILLSKVNNKPMVIKDVFIVDGNTYIETKELGRGFIPERFKILVSHKLARLFYG